MTDFNKEVKKLYSSNNKFFIKIRRKKKDQTLTGKK